jgi:hypothetical protein
MNRKERRKEGAKLLLVLLSLATLLGYAFSDGWQYVAPLPSGYVAGDGAGLAFGKDQNGVAQFIYAILGGVGGSDEFLRYDCENNLWDLSPLNDPAFYPGAALTSDRSDYFYALKGGNTQAFWRYRASDNSWLQYPDIPAAVTPGGALAYAQYGGQGWVYAIIGGGSNRFFQWGPIALPGGVEPNVIPMWRELQPLTYPGGSRPVGAYPGASLAWIPGTDSVFCIGITPGYWETVLAYSQATSTWNSSADLTSQYSPGPGAALSDATLSGYHYVYYLFGDMPYPTPTDNYCYRHGVGNAPPSWQSRSKTKSPEQRPGCAMTYSPYTQSLYALMGGNTASFQRDYITITDVGGAQTSSVNALGEVSVTSNPNPFREKTMIHFSLARSGPCRVAVYKATGELAARLFDGNLAAGSHTVTWNRLTGSSASLPSGIYILRVSAGSTQSCLKLLAE